MIPASWILKPFSRISSMLVISPEATFLPRFVFGIQISSTLWDQAENRLHSQKALLISISI